MRRGRGEGVTASLDAGIALRRPRTSQPHYGRHLGDVGYWSPYVRAVLARSGLPTAPIEPPFVGTFPTFLVGDVVVKLFGDTFDGGHSFAVEQAMHELLAGHPDIRAPGLVSSGHLFDDGGWRWPYLVTERVEGVAIRDAGAGTDALAEVAGELGALVARLHRLPPPAAVVERELLPGLRAGAAERMAGFGLPDHLVEQVPGLLGHAPEDRVLVHADITADHVFVEGDRLVAVIDWGDALQADPWYELVAVRFDALRGDPAAFAAFLEAAGWPCAAEFPRRALQGVLEFQFDAITSVAAIVDLHSVRTLDELADALFGSFVVH